MRSSTRTLLTATGSAMAASAVTAAVLLPLSGAFADPVDPPRDWGECTGPYVKGITLEEALPYLEAEGYTPAEGPLDGFEIGYVPEFAGGEPFDSVWEDDEEEWPLETSRVWIDPDGIELETWPDQNGDPADRFALWGGGLTVSVQRDDRVEDVESYLTEFQDVTVEEYFEGQDVRELESGTGFYTDTDALWVPEPGVVLTVFLWAPEWDEEYSEEYVEPVGDHDEVLKVVEGITPV
ncbi:hypothetical protein PWG71_03445 [Nocardiopsis sp. N85]|uniref:hypothetical protein n=1 Tax=Nocardiopsis sp. N85 TaxID=3029400 RepID=UPI00237F16AF|nr:hypothetical protein [Nocardiopsis sp. N85]MDE3720428.1 hypothetical protein [Nocardiopsis sp. N85]